MTFHFNNQSVLPVNIYIDQLCISLPREQAYTYIGHFDCMPIEIKFSFADKKTCKVDDCSQHLYISTTVLCDFLNLSDVTFDIREKINRFQNYTEYRYLIVSSSDAHFRNVQHALDSIETQQDYLPGRGKNKFMHIVKKSVIDTLIEGLFLSVVLAWIFSWKVAIIFFLVFFAVAFMINAVRLKLSKSKRRSLNWNKDEDLPDDTAYFVENLEKYCE